MSDLARISDPAVLKAHYLLNGNANDISGHKNNGTWTAGEAYADGFSSRMVADPGAGRIETNSPTGFVLDSYTVAVWVKHDSGSVSGNEVAVAIGAGVITNTTFWIGVQNTTPDKLIVSHGGSASDIPIANADSAWHHICGVKTPTELRAFLDGDLVAIDTGANVPLSNTNVTIGDYGNRAGLYYWNGLISSVRVYSAILAGTEVASLYQLELEGKF